MAQRPKYFNTGSQFENDKATSDTHPHMKGLVDIEGTLFWVSSWWKQTKNGKDFLSHSFTQVTDEEMQKYFEGQSPPEGYFESKKPDRPRPGRPSGDHRNPTEADRPAQPARGREMDFDDLDDDLPF